MEHPVELRAALQRAWNSGRLLAGAAQPGELFLLRVRVKGPTSAELGTRFEDVRTWVANLRTLARALESREINHRQLGGNAVPTAVSFDTIDSVAAAIGKTRVLQRFRALVTGARRPELIPLLAQRRLDALAESDAWPLVLDLVDWMAAHPRPENEINYLAFPDSPSAIVVFGAGSGFEHFAHVPWLTDVAVHYWGDIDTHGMAILDQLRATVPHVLALYNDLRDNRLQANLRLEQERIRFNWVRTSVAAVVT